MADLQSKLAASGTVIVPARSGNACQILPDELCLEVLRFSSAYDLGRLGRTGTTMRTLSLRALTQLPGDWVLRRMGKGVNSSKVSCPQDRRVYFTSDANQRAQWEKPSRADVPPPPVDADWDDPHPPQYHWPERPPPPRMEMYPPGDWMSTRFDGDVFWFSYNLRVSQWDRPCYEDAPRFWVLGKILRANAHYRTRTGSNYSDQSP